MPEVDSDLGEVEEFAVLKDKVIRNGGNLELPSLWVKDKGFNHSSQRMDRIKCEGYTFTNK
jgi:hypothetical protein